MYSLPGDSMFKMNMDPSVTRILSKYKKVYLMSYEFILYFTVTVNEHQLLLKLMYKIIHQSSYKYKLLKFSLDCDLEKELPVILSTLYQKNIEQKFKLKTNKVTKEEMCSIWSTSHRGRHIETSNCVSPLIKYTHSTLHSHLMDPRCPDK